MWYATAIQSRGSFCMHEGNIPMKMPFLLSRVLLKFGHAEADLCQQLSAATITPDGCLWISSDELRTIERLTPKSPVYYGKHQSFDLGDYVQLFDTETEVDIEGLDYAAGYLWFTGSHSSKRQKPKGKKLAKDLELISTVTSEPNRNLLGRIPLRDGAPCVACPDPEQPERTMRAATLRTVGKSNVLVEALREDPHLGPFLTFPLPSKENGFDIEGMAVFGEQIWLGFRGPVLRGWAALIEIAVEEGAPGQLELRPIGPDGQLYRKHFLHMGGLGVRELCCHGDDLLVLAGPTMELEGAMQLYRFKGAAERSDQSLTSVESGDLELVFDLPFTLGSDHAEGIALLPWLGKDPAVLIVYDAPDPARMRKPDQVFADIFRL
jgi:Protein of unknown function (DUF3616)